MSGTYQCFSRNNQGIITYSEPCKTGFGSSRIWSSYSIVIICNISLVDTGKHLAVEASLKLFLTFSHTDDPVSQHQIPLVHILTLDACPSRFPVLLVSMLNMKTPWHSLLPIFLFPLTQAFGTFVVNAAYRARKANSLMDHFSKCIIQTVFCLF